MSDNLILCDICGEDFSTYKYDNTNYCDMCFAEFRNDELEYDNPDE